MKDGKRKRDMVKLEDDANSVEEVNDIGSQLIKRDLEVNQNFLNEGKEGKAEPTDQQIEEEGGVT